MKSLKSGDLVVFAPSKKGAPATRRQQWLGQMIGPKRLEKEAHVLQQWQKVQLHAATERDEEHVE